MNKIKYVSFIFCLLFQLIFVGIIAAQFLGWAYAPLSVIPVEYRSYLLHPFDVNTQVAGFFITLPITLMELAAFYFLIKLFSLYKRFEFFTFDNVRYIRNAGYALLLLQITKPACEFLLGFILTSRNPPGFRLAIATINEKSIALIITALVIILVSWVMAEGCKMNNEQQLTI